MKQKTSERQQLAQSFLFFCENEKKDLVSREIIEAKGRGESVVKIAVSMQRSKTFVYQKIEAIALRGLLALHGSLSDNGCNIDGIKDNAELAWLAFLIKRKKNEADGSSHSYITSIKRLIVLINSNGLPMSIKELFLVPSVQKQLKESKTLCVKNNIIYASTQTGKLFYNLSLYAKTGEFSTAQIYDTISRYCPGLFEDKDVKSLQDLNRIISLQSSNAKGFIRVGVKTWEPIVYMEKLKETKKEA